MTSVVAPLVTLCCLAGAASADAKAVWSSGANGDPRARLALQLRHEKAGDYLHASGRQSVVTANYGGVPSELATSVHIVRMASSKLCPRRPALGPEDIVDDLNYELASQRSFDVSWNVVYQEKTRVCGYLVRDLNPAPYAGTIGEVQHRYAVVARAEAITPVTAAARAGKAEHGPVSLVDVLEAIALLALVSAVFWSPILWFVRRRRRANASRTPGGPAPTGDSPRRPSVPPSGSPTTPRPAEGMRTPARWTSRRLRL